MIVLVPLNATAENNMDGLVSLSMSNVEDGSPLMWGHVVGMWLISFIVYFTLRKNYREILEITQNFKATKMRNYSVLVQNLPERFQTDEALLGYFRQMYGDDVYAAVVAHDIGKLDKKVWFRVYASYPFWLLCYGNFF